MASEHPEIGFTCLIVGECAGGEGDGQTGMNVGWDMDLAMKAVPLWSSRGCMPGKLMPVEDLIEVVHTICAPMRRRPCRLLSPGSARKHGGVSGFSGR